MNTRSLIVLVLALVMLLPASAAFAQTDEQPQVADTTHAEESFVDYLNASRAEEGHAALIPNAELQGIARAWSAEMADVDELSHNPNYADQYEGDWQRMGENVGYTSSSSDLDGAIERLHQAFMDSSGHYANIMGEYNQLAVGVVITDAGALWVTVNFLEGDIPAESNEPTDTSENPDAQPQDEAPAETTAGDGADQALAQVPAADGAGAPANEGTAEDSNPQSSRSLGHFVRG